MKLNSINSSKKSFEIYCYDNLNISIATPSNKTILNFFLICLSSNTESLQLLNLFKHFIDYELLELSGLLTLLDSSESDDVKSINNLFTFSYFYVVILFF